MKDYPHVLALTAVPAGHEGGENRGSIRWLW